MDGFIEYRVEKFDTVEGLVKCVRASDPVARSIGKYSKFCDPCARHIRGRSHTFFAFARARRMEAVPLHRSEQYNGLAPRDCAAWMRFSGMGVEQTAHLGFIVHRPEIKSDGHADARHVVSVQHVLNLGHTIG